MRAALYLRASTVKQTEEGYSLEYQKDKLLGYANLKDWTIIEEYVDAGESGRTTKRPAFNRMVEDAQNDRFDTVLVYKLDRFSRSLQDLLNVINILEKHKVSVWSVTQSYDDSTPEGRLMRNMLGSFAQFESEMIGARVKDGMGRRAKEGEWSTAPPYGYQWTGTLELIPEEVSTIHHVLDRYEDGASMQTIADELNVHSTTKRGGKWNPNTIRRILTNPIYHGKMLYHGTLIETSYPKVVTEERYLNIARIRSERCRKTPKISKS
jgi:site-specific DNA recombinase